MKYYATLENNICVGFQSSTKKEKPENAVEIPQELYGNNDLLYRKYENGQWSEEKYIPDYSQIELDRMEAVEQAVAELSILIAMGGANDV